MKKTSILLLSSLLIFGLGIAIFAYSRSPIVADNPAACCKGDSCPLKKKTAETGDKTSAGEHCCKDGAESCPMKKAGDRPAKMDHGKNMKMANGESCPMMKDGGNKTTAGSGDHNGDHKMKHEMPKDADHKMAHGAGHGTSAEHKGCPCCSHDKEQKAEGSI